MIEIGRLALFGLQVSADVTPVYYPVSAKNLNGRLLGTR